MDYFNENEQFGGAFSFLENNSYNDDRGIGEAMFTDPGRAMKPDPGFGNGSDHHGIGRVLNFGMTPARTASCPPSVAAAMAEVAKSNGKDFKKRKSDDNQNIKEKKVRECDDEEGSKITEQSSHNNSTITTNNKKKGPSLDNNSKASDIPKPDYIHVRARRGQATDSHSLAERVRREKISERMKYLQDLVPGCNKITGKAGMLDEIINYVHSLQRQVEFLSMKLAVINPTMDFHADNYLPKEMFPACTSSVPTIGVPLEMVNHGEVQFNTLGQGDPCSSGLQIGANPSDFTLRRTISAPVPFPVTLLDSSSLNHNQFLTWDAELQSQYSMEFQQGIRSASSSFISQPFTGYVETGHVKLEM